MKISSVARNAACDAVVDLVDAGTPPGKIFIRSGPAPTNTTDGDSGVLLATLTFSTTAFGNAGASNPGEAIAATITGEASIDADGTAEHFRIKNAAGTTIAQGSVGTSGDDINFNSITFVTGGTVDISSLTLTVPSGSN